MHDPDWPSGLIGATPRMLWLSSPRTVFNRLCRSPRVAILGGRAASPYGIEMAGALARGLAAAGVTVVAGLGGALGRAAHAGAEEVQAGSLAVAGDGLAGIRPAAAARMASAVARRGCVVSQLSGPVNGRGWGVAAAEATVASLGDVAIVLESEASGSVANLARSAMSSGRVVGAIPGPITSRLSAGPHTLILEGATLIRDAGDVLELLYASRPGEARCGRSTRRTLKGFDRTVLERVGAGEDTPERLVRGRRNAGSVLAALGRLELAGALRRLPDGRYQAREAAPRHASGS
jgi:DNA processing protein